MRGAAAVWLVDDDREVRDALSLLLRSAGHRIHAHASGEALLDVVSPHCRGCLVIDVRLQGMDGLALQRELIRRHIHLPRIFISGHGDIPLAVKAVNEGGRDFLEKPPDEQALLRAIETAIEADRVWFADYADTLHTERLLDTLTPREFEVMTLMLDGQPSKLIADTLGASVRTIEVHRARILEKLEVENSGEMISRVLATPSRGARDQNRNP